MKYFVFQELFKKSKEYSDIPDAISRTPKKKGKPAKKDDEEEDDDDEDEDYDDDISDKPNLSVGKRKTEQEPTDVPAKRGKKEVLPKKQRNTNAAISFTQKNIEMVFCYFFTNGTFRIVISIVKEVDKIKYYLRNSLTLMLQHNFYRRIQRWSFVSLVAKLVIYFF